MQHQWPKPGNEPFELPDIEVTDTTHMYPRSRNKRSTLPNLATD